MSFELFESITLSQFGKQRIPDPSPSSNKTPIAISVPCTLNSTRQCENLPFTHSQALSLNRRHVTVVQDTWDRKVMWSEREITKCNNVCIFQQQRRSLRVLGRRAGIQQVREGARWRRTSRMAPESLLPACQAEDLSTAQRGRLDIRERGVVSFRCWRCTSCLRSITRRSPHWEDCKLHLELSRCGRPKTDLFLATHFEADMATGWVSPWLGLGWVRSPQHTYSAIGVVTCFRVNIV